LENHSLLDKIRRINIVVVVASAVVAIAVATVVDVISSREQ